MIERATAYKTDIASLEKGEWKEDRIQVNNRSMKRVRVMGTIIQKYLSDDNNYGFLVIDDETGTMRAKAFKQDLSLMEGKKAGDIVEVIGSIRKYNDETYISPEIIRRIKDPNKYFLRKLELLKGFKTKEKVEVAEEYFADTKRKEEILKTIKSLENEGGAEFDDVLKKTKMSKKDMEMVLYNLLKDGDIYEPKPKTYKVL